VLINLTVASGANSRPDVTAQANSHGDNADTAGPQRRATAVAAATIALTASATCDPPGAGSRGSGSSVHNNAVNAERTGPAREANRRSQPRTVAAGRPNRSAIRRCPKPFAAHPNAAPITPTVSARRIRQRTGNNTCVQPHPRQIARRGRSRHLPSPSSRTTRQRACPHGLNTVSHTGHNNRPDTSRRSTSAESTPTVSTGASEHLTALPAAQPKTTGRALLTSNMLTLSSDTKDRNPTRATPTPTQPQ
jgi:hypothetical protein